MMDTGFRACRFFVYGGRFAMRMLKVCMSYTDGETEHKLCVGLMAVYSY